MSEILPVRVKSNTLMNLDSKIYSKIYSKKFSAKRGQQLPKAGKYKISFAVEFEEGLELGV